MSTHNIYFMENWRKLSHNYHQILLLDISSEASLLYKIYNMYPRIYPLTLEKIKGMGNKQVMDIFTVL